MSEQSQIGASTACGGPGGAHRRDGQACGDCGAPMAEGSPLAQARPRRRIMVVDLPSVFWPVAEARRREEQKPEGAALAALRHLRALADRYRCPITCFASEQKPYWRASASIAGEMYKRGRAGKPPELVAELAELGEALTHAGFPVVIRAEGRPYDPDEPEGGQGSQGPRPCYFCYFEADDVAASIATKIVAAGDCAVVVSNDWDMAQLLPDEGVGAPNEEPEGARPARVYLARANGADRWVDPADVRRTFGVPPSKLWCFLALAGDGDFKPYPGPKKEGAKRQEPGIGETTAGKLLAKFGSFDTCLAAALSDLALAKAAFAEFPPRVLELLRAGGEEQAAKARLLAKLRLDVPIAPEVWGGFEDAERWEEAERFLRWLLRKKGGRLALSEEIDFEEMRREQKGAEEQIAEAAAAMQTGGRSPVCIEIVPGETLSVRAEPEPELGAAMTTAEIAAAMDCEVLREGLVRPCSAEEPKVTSPEKLEEIREAAPPPR